MNSAALLLAIETLASTGITLYQTIKGESANGNVAKVALLVPVANLVAAAMQNSSATLQQVQTEKWADDDPRWGAVFTARDAALAAAEAML